MVVFVYFNEIFVFLELLNMAGQCEKQSPFSFYSSKDGTLLWTWSSALKASVS